MANVGCWSIELEPRTLRGGQLNHAREAAADVARKFKPNDATIIFVEGLRPVGSIKTKQITENQEEDQENDDDKVVELIEKKEQIVELSCQCPCKYNNATSDSVKEDNNKLIIREPLSAPF